MKIQKGVKDRLDSINSSLDELSEILTILSSEIGFLQGFAKGSDTKEQTQFWRRTHVRQVGASIESVSYSLRRMAIDAVESGFLDLEPGALQLLQERRYSLDKGKINFKTAFNKVEENVILGFRYAARAGYSAFEIDTSKKFWNDLLLFIKLRNRVTHPKSLADLHVSEEDHQFTTVVLTSFVEQVLLLFQDLRASTKKAWEEEQGRLKRALNGITKFAEEVQSKMPGQETPD